MLRVRIITALILLALFLSALFLLPDPVWGILILVIVMQGISEWSRLANLSAKAANVYWWLTLAVMGSIVYLDVGLTLALHPIPHLLVYWMSALLWLVVVPLWLLLGWQVRHPMLMALVGWALLIPTGLAMLDLRDNSPWLLLGIMMLVWVADCAAYFSGRAYGKHKLAPNISPGKTWEGVAGALAAVSLCVLVGFLFSGYAHLYKFLPTIILAGWCWVALAVLGDLFESAIKRQAGVKDSGALLPGHGGLLDRIDALTSTLPLAALAMLSQKLA
jgi:phosphatidate cytidylyltransferase